MSKFQPNWNCLWYLEVSGRNLGSRLMHRSQPFGSLVQFSHPWTRQIKILNSYTKYIILCEHLHGLLSVNVKVFSCKYFTCYIAIIMIIKNLLILFTSVDFFLQETWTALCFQKVCIKVESKQGVFVVAIKGFLLTWRWCMECKCTWWGKFIVSLSTRTCIPDISNFLKYIPYK